MPPEPIRRDRPTALALVAISLASITGDAPARPASPVLPEMTGAFLDRYCYSCHDEDTQKGDIRLDTLGELETSKRLDLLNRMNLPLDLDS